VKSLRTRLALWFGVSFLAVTAVFTFVTHWHLEDELRHKTWQKDYPDHPDWTLHGSFSESEVDDILEELIKASLIASIPLVALAAIIGYWLARKSLRPIASVNHQLQMKTPKNLGVPIELPEADAEFKDLLCQLNDLLKRLDVSFTEMNNYAAKVAHELRTPLAILRLKVEHAGHTVDPELAEELQSELHRLGHVVDQSLLIARAEHGRLSLRREPCDLQSIVADIVEDFQLLAREENRGLKFSGPTSAPIVADQSHLRQIIHNLLANALKHGQGDFLVNVRSAGTRQSLSIVNRVEWCSIDSEFALGLGLRVVKVLLRLDPEIHYRSRRANTYYGVRLSFPAAREGSDMPERIGTAWRTIPNGAAGTPAGEDENYFI
jgi:signal transduction histidine kinase